MINALKPAVQHLREAQQTVLGNMYLLTEEHPRKTIVLNSHAYLLFTLWEDRDKPHVEFFDVRIFRGSLVICSDDDIADGTSVLLFDLDNIVRELPDRDQYSLELVS